MTARSVAASEPITFPLNVLPFQSFTRTEVAPETTWLLVTMSPRRSYTMPEPSASPVSVPPNGLRPCEVATVMSTTPW